MPQISVRGYSFEYNERGQGQPLVFVHGSSSDLRTWESQQAEFSRQYRTIAYSRRFHWPNSEISPGADYSMLEHVDDLRALISSLETPPAHLIGHSYGAFVSLLLAIEEPELVRSLVLAEPPVITLFVSNEPKPGEILKLLVRRPRTALAFIKFGIGGAERAKAAARRDDLDAVLKIMGKAVFGQEAFRNLSESRLEQGRANTIKAELLGSGFAPVDDEQVRQVSAPVLLVRGQNSPKMFHRILDRLEELLPNTESVTIPGKSHLMHETDTASYNAAVRSFLSKHA
jgi:pimeloyl-ACP methyl ester carboxylesterase